MEGGREGGGGGREGRGMVRLVNDNRKEDRNEDDNN